MDIFNSVWCRKKIFSVVIKDKHPEKFEQFERISGVTSSQLIFLFSDLYTWLMVNSFRTVYYLKYTRVLGKQEILEAQNAQFFR